MKIPIHFMLAGLLAGCVYAQSPYSSLQVPKQIQYQGRVATGTGVALSDREGYFSFALVQVATVLWNNREGTASPSDAGAFSLGAGPLLALPVNQGVFSVRLGEGTDTNEQIPPQTSRCGALTHSVNWRFATLRRGRLPWPIVMVRLK